MYVRIARFEGAQPDQLDSQLDGIRRQISEGRQRISSGEVGGDEAAGMQALTRVVVAVDRQTGRTASLMFADGEEEIRKVDEWMNSMSPGAGGGQRTSVEMLEVAIDEQLG